MKKERGISPTFHSTQKRIPLGCISTGNGGPLGRGGGEEEPKRLDYFERGIDWGSKRRQTAANEKEDRESETPRLEPKTVK